jgi:hypothetical protein
MKLKDNSSYKVFFLSFIFFSLITHSHVFLAGNDASRFAHIESLVDRGVSEIDQSGYRWTRDKITIGDHDYSNKPPLLGGIGAAIYWVLKQVLGISFIENEELAVYFLTLIIVGGATSFLVAQFYTALSLYPDIKPEIRKLVTFALLTGTILTSFSATFNNHTIAAALIFPSFYYALLGRALLSGIFIGLAFCIDIVPGLVFLPVVALIIYDLKNIKGIKELLIPIVAFVGLFISANYFTVGHFLPPKFVAGGHDYSSAFSSNLFGVLLPESYLYPIKCLFGSHGIFTVSPILIFGVAGVLKAYRHEKLFSKRWLGSLISACIFFIVGHILFVGSFGGWSYGFRYLIPIIPILLFFSPVVLEKKNIKFFKGVLAISILFAFIGVYNPWPPGFEQEKGVRELDRLVTNPIAGNATAFMVEHLPSLSLTEKMVQTFINHDKSKSNQFLMYYFYSKGDKEMTLKFMKLQNE